MVSELVTNGIKYGAIAQDDTIVLDLRINGGVRCAVIDPGSGFPAQAPGPDGAPPDGHFGLKLVDQLAQRWGVTRQADCTEVWVETGSART
jgi:two-component sensor histidine kinase